MKAIETTGKIDAQGQLSLDLPLNVTQPSAVRVIILVSESDEQEIEQPTDKILAQIHQYQERELMSEKEFRVGFQSALAEKGYDSRDKIIQLVQEIKQEIATEREAKETS